MFKVSVIGQPMDFVLVDSIVHIFGGVYMIEEESKGIDEVLDFDLLPNLIFECTGDAFECDYSDFPNIIYSKTYYHELFPKLKEEYLKQIKSNGVKMVE